MVAADDILDVEVQSAEVFGLFCRAGGHEVLVLIPETSWVASFCSRQQFAIPGDQFRVQVLRVDAKTGQASASIKAMHPDPWPSGRLAVGTLHQARVVRAINSADRCGDGPGHLLELLPGAYVVLCGRLPLVCGQSCLIQVVASDFYNRAVHVALAERPDAEPGAAADRGRM